MPLYKYECSFCGTEAELLLKMSEMEEPLHHPCPECGSEGTITQQVTNASIGDSIRLGIHRPDAGWGEVLSKVKSAHPRGNWNKQKFVPTSGR